MKIKTNQSPNIEIPEFIVDKPLHEKLDLFELTKHLNKSNFTLFLGKPGSGKTSMMVSFLKTKDLFKKVFHTIILFMPPTSRGSLKNDFLNKNIPENQIYDEVSIENLEEVENICKENANENYNTLLVFDDVQKYIRENKQVESQILGIINNRRHLRTTLWMCNQNYKSLSIKMRSAITNIFIFNISKKEMEYIFQEILEVGKHNFENIVYIFNKEKEENPYSFLFIDVARQKIFLNWDEIDELDD